MKQQGQINKFYKKASIPDFSWQKKIQAWNLQVTGSCHQVLIYTSVSNRFKKSGLKVTTDPELVESANYTWSVRTVSTMLPYLDQDLTLQFAWQYNYKITGINLVKIVWKTLNKRNLPDGEAPPAFVSPYPPFGRVWRVRAACSPPPLPPPGLAPCNRHHSPPLSSLLPDPTWYPKYVDSKGLR